MIFKKDNLLFGSILGLIIPLGGIVLYKAYIFGNGYSFKEVIQYMFYQQSHALLSVALTLSLLLNALFFTIYVNTGRDKTAIGIFITTIAYGMIVLLLKTFG
jgi:hypothetical protein